LTDIDWQTDTQEVKSENSTPLIPAAIIGHNPELVPCTSHPQAHLSYIVLLFSNLLLGRPSGCFPRCFPAKIMFVFLISSIWATCPAPLSFPFHYLNIPGDLYNLQSFSLYNIHNFSLPSSLLGSSIFLGTLVINTFHNENNDDDNNNSIVCSFDDFPIPNVNCKCMHIRI